MFHESDSSSSASSATAWVLWVLGWQWFAGVLLFVVPAFIILGQNAAYWATGGVLLCSTIVAWLSAEATRALEVPCRTELDSPPDSERSISAEHQSAG